MEASDLFKIRDQIVSATTKYLAQKDQWATIDIIKSSTTDLVARLCSIVQTKQKNSWAEREPQSESEESKQGLNFVKAIAKEARQFIQTVENLAVVNEADLRGLRAMLERQKSEIEQLGKFKDECGGPF